MSDPKILNQKYRLDRLIGRGGFGEVYRATDLTLEREVAVKLIKKSISDEADMAARFIKEARMTSQLKHPHTLTIYDFGQHQGQLFLVSELLEGQSLRAFLDQERHLQPQEMISLFIPICRALHEAHLAGVIHRDLKPDNLFLHRSFNTDKLTLLDFGIAKTVGQTHLTQTGHYIGTPQYMAPEQIKDARNVNHLADIYSLGIILFEALAGAEPYQGDSVFDIFEGHIRGEIPELGSLVSPELKPFDTLITKMMAKHPLNRPQSASEVAEHLDALQEHSWSMISVSQLLTRSVPMDSDASTLGDSYLKLHAHPNDKAPHDDGPSAPSSSDLHKECEDTLEPNIVDSSLDAQPLDDAQTLTPSIRTHLADDLNHDVAPQSVPDDDGPDVDRPDDDGLDDDALTPSEPHAAEAQSQRSYLTWTLLSLLSLYGVWAYYTYLNEDIQLGVHDTGPARSLTQEMNAIRPVSQSNSVQSGANYARPQTTPPPQVIARVSSMDTPPDPERPPVQGVHSTRDTRSTKQINPGQMTISTQDLIADPPQRRGRGERLKTRLNNRQKARQRARQESRKTTRRSNHDRPQARFTINDLKLELSPTQTSYEPSAKVKVYVSPQKDLSSRKQITIKLQPPRLGRVRRVRHTLNGSTRILVGAIEWRAEGRGRVKVCLRNECISRAVLIYDLNEKHIPKEVNTSFDLNQVE